MTKSDTANTIQIPLINKTGLDESQYTIYVLGYSTASPLMLDVVENQIGGFVPVPNQTGSLPALKLGEDITQINVDLNQNVNGSRIYFFVADNQTFPTPPRMSYSNQGQSVTNPPNPPTTSVPPYSFIEFTNNTSYGAVIDVQTVDGFTFPVNITLNDDLGAIGQPLSGGITRNAILGAYSAFMNALGSSGAPYLDLHSTAPMAAACSTPASTSPRRIQRTSL